MKPYWKRSFNLENTIIGCLAGAICALILFILAMLFVDAWIEEDNERVARLHKHLYDITLGTDVTPPKAPTVLQPNYGEPSKPKVTYFQDTSEKPKKGR
jgi:hypothetical protein